MKEKNSFCFIILILLLLLSFKSIEKTLKNIRLISYNSETWSKIANDKGFIKQFESYLQEVDEIKDLAYVINSNKANINEVKQAFKEVFKRNSDEILKFMNPKLKESLGIINPNDKVRLEKLINDTNSALYNFIKTQ
ncbi:hypothetical protein [Capnocytophaga sp. oral taxon 326]|uniref:hypothetical protein n=1 Tax=Capnocytophaga sp. oral taxon 326 TaxID=712212 RepID=UPI0002A2F712|nr:hypothetical protein [Capnocytophaga sp. oral taxon 326]EKY11956.1 hypothetical protein HMPREF9073_02881 [Capnocytophaga sp. oral taxon 326 str. F0382]